MNHKELVTIAERWLRKARGCSAVITEMVTYANEIPDAIGWRDGISYKVECKVSRADFFRDKDKPSRRTRPENMMGVHRYYMCPEGMIAQEELPEGWGLVYVNDKGKARMVCGQKSNANADTSYTFKRHIQGMRNEIIMLTSCVRRYQESDRGEG
jgi:hypothetical protein